MADAEVKVAIVGDNSSLQRSLSESRSGLASFGAAVGRIAVAAGIAAAGGLAILGKASIDAAAEAEQSIGATETVFGKFADTVIRQSQRAATGLGLSADQYRQNANTLGALLSNQGVAADELAGKTRGLIKTGADLAATFGGDTKTAVDALASAFKGEFDPLEQYGISIKQSTVNTEAMRVANVKTTAAFNDLSTAQQAAAKQQATANLITKQSAKAQGQFARETDTLAHQQQVLGAQWDDLKVKLGTALLPVVTKLFKRLNNDLMPALSDFADQHLPAITAALDELVGSDPSEWFGDAADKASSFGDALSQIDWGSLGESAGETVDAVKQLGPALAEVSIDEVNDGIRVFGTVVGFAADHLDTLEKLLPAIVAGYVALKAAQLANSIAGRDSVIGLVAQWAATRRLIAAQRELVAITREVAIAQGVQLGSTERLAAGTTGLTGKLSKLGPIARTVGGVAGLGLLALGAETSNQSLAGLSTTAGGVITGFSVGGPWGAAIGGAIGVVQSFRQANDDMVASLDAVDTARASGDLNAWAASIENARGEVDKMRPSLSSYAGVGLGVFGLVKEGPKLWQQWTGGIGDADEALAEQQRTLDGVRDGTIQLFNPVRDLATAIGNVAQNAIDEADALQKSIDAMRDKRREASRGLDAELDYQQAIDDANAALKENGRTVNKSTEAGRANLRALTSLADAWNDQSSAAKNAQGSLKAARGNFVDTAKAMGLSADAAKRLADRLFEIPPKRKTAIQLDGVDIAAQKAKTLRDIIRELNNKDIYVTTHYQTIGNKPKAPTPGGGDAPRLGAPSPKQQAQQTDKMRLYGEQLGRAAVQGARQGADKESRKGPSLVEKLFGDATSLDKIKAGIDAIAKLVEKTVSRRIKDGKQAAKRSKQILDDLSKREKKLRQVGAAQDKLASQLDDAKQKLQDAKDAATSYAASIHDAFVSFGDISQLGRGDSGRVSLPKLLSQLRARAKDAAEFNRLIQQLAKMNLAQTQIEQLTAQGPEGGLATARAIASGGRAAVDEINKLSRQIAGSGSSLGAALSDRYKQAGIDGAQAYVDELTRQQDGLDKTARRMARTLVATMRDELNKGAKQGKQPDKQPDDNKRPTVTVKLTAQQVSQLQRGREIQADLDAYRAAGGRART